MGRLSKWWKIKTCRHIFQVTAVDYLKEFEHSYPLGPSIEIDTYRAFAVTNKCVKCGYVHKFERNVKVYPWNMNDTKRPCCECGKILIFDQDCRDDYYISCCGVLQNKNGVSMNEDIFD